MDTWLERIAQNVGVTPETIARLLKTVAIMLLYLVTRRVLLSLARRRIKDVKRHYHWQRAIKYATGFALLILLTGVWFSGLENIATVLGLVTAGLAIALQDPLSNLAGWLFIVTRRPYSVGDRIEIAGHLGDVIDIRLFQTYLMECGNWVAADQATGRVLGIPNGIVFKSTNANYTRGFEYIWDEIPVLVTFESDWRKAKRLLEGIAETVAQPMSADSQRQIRHAASKQMIFFQKLTPIIYTSVQDSGVLLTMRYLTPPRQRRGNAQLIWEAILDAYAQETDVDFAYPTMRQFRNITEGKPGTRPEPILSS